MTISPVGAIALFIVYIGAGLLWRYFSNEGNIETSPDNHDVLEHEEQGDATLDEIVETLNMRFAHGGMSAVLTSAFVKRSVKLDGIILYLIEDEQFGLTALTGDLLWGENLINIEWIVVAPGLACMSQSVPQVRTEWEPQDELNTVLKRYTALEIFPSHPMNYAHRYLLIIDEEPAS